ncbi:exodeoxyribonuclease V subunit beta [Ningiella sp. W23]|uniref:exodeoxyribonuclease V subunit beta n=1 Tax=Ningiella sp. W23 TaxID=3023715 RepID=UPI0037564845
MQVKPLNVINMSLEGVHLIEASAGTGKTFNITRIVMRILLETELSIEQILVVTFTKAATEELRERIAKTITEFLADFHGLEASLDASDGSESDTKNPVISHFLKVCLETLPIAHDDAIALGIKKLKTAALMLDEAPIYTINAFCQKMLAKANFQNRLDFNTKIVNSPQSLFMEAVQDYFRRLASDEKWLSFLHKENMATPSQFFDQTRAALLDSAALIAMSEEESKTRLLDELSVLKTAPVVDEYFAIFSEHKNVLEAEMLRTDAGASQYTSLLKWLEIQLSYDDLASEGFAALPALIAPSVGNILGKQKLKAIVKLAEKGMINLDLARYETAATALKTHIDDAKKSITATITLLEKAPFLERLCRDILALKDEVTLKKREQSVMDHNDTVMKLAQLLNQEGIDAESASQNQGTELRNYLRCLYPVALIDEFQDTDPYQYQVFSTLYPKGSENMLLMIGDPKQAIYGFRGGDIFTYLQAAKNVNHHWSMQHNFRSSQAMIDSYNALFYGFDLASNTLSKMKAMLPSDDWERDLNSGEIVSAYHNDTEQSALEPPLLQNAFGNDIRYSWIYPGKQAHQIEQLIEQNESYAALHLYVNEPLYDSDSKVNARAAFKQESAQYTAKEICRLLNTTQFLCENGVSEPTQSRELEAKDIAVLVRTGSEAQAIRKALQQVNIKSVYLSNKQNIFTTPEAVSLYNLMQGVLHYRNKKSVFQALASELLGLDFQELAAIQNGDDQVFERNIDLLVSLANIWTRHGIYYLVNVLLKRYFKARVDAQDYERAITNYLHLADILQQQSKRQAQSISLIAWFEKQIAAQHNREEQTEEDDTYTQRLESDEALIKIVTLHGSKGLEYPVVFIPFAGFASKPRTQLVNKIYSQDAKRQQIYIGATSELIRAREQQEFAEDMRLLYVGITRAANRCYLGLGKPKDLQASPVGQLLGVSHNPNGSSNPEDVLARLTEICKTHPDLYTLHTYSNIPIEPYENAKIDKQSFAAQMFTGNTASVWQLHSFSRIAKYAPHVDLRNKDRDQYLRSISSPEGNTDELALRFRAPRNADTGNLLHNILEDHDFSQPFNISEHHAHLVAYAPAQASNQNDSFGIDEEELSQWIEDVLACPIYIQGEQSSATFHLNDLKYTLKEPEFYFPIEEVSMATLMHMLAKHRGLSADELMLNKETINGMMHGFIDLLFEHEGKYYVADYKSNYLGDDFADYHYEALHQSIMEHNYDLQYLIYSWALHKFLLSRLADYNFSQHFGGVYYFYLRGMSSQGPKGSGVFYQAISQSDLNRLSMIFETKAPHEDQHVMDTE